jgi:hypothetical protein
MKLVGELAAELIERLRVERAERQESEKMKPATETTVRATMASMAMRKGPRLAVGEGSASHGCPMSGGGGSAERARYSSAPTSAGER